MAKTKTKAEGKAETTSKKDGPKPAENKKRGATGQTWGLNVGQTWLKMLEENRTKKLTDKEMVDFMCAEFPEQKTYTVEDMRLHRNLFNRGRIRDQEPFGVELPEEEKLHEWALKDGKKVKLPLKVRKAGGGGKTKKASTEDVPDEPDFDDEEDAEEEESKPKRKRRKAKKSE